MNGIEKTAQLVESTDDIVAATEREREGRRENRKQVQLLAWNEESDACIAVFAMHYFVTD